MFTTDTPPALSGTLPEIGEGTLREAAPRLWGGVFSMCRIVFFKLVLNIRSGGYHHF